MEHATLTESSLKPDHRLSHRLNQNKNDKDEEEDEDEDFKNMGGICPTSTGS